MLLPPPSYHRSSALGLSNGKICCCERHLRVTTVATPPQHLLPKHCQSLLSTFSPSYGNSSGWKGEIGPIYCQRNSNVLLVSSAFVAFLQSLVRSLILWKMLPLISWARGDWLNECLCMCPGLTVVTWGGGSRKDKALIST